MQTEKLVNEVFSDYPGKTNIINAKILNLNLIKKENLLSLDIQSEEYIEIKDLWDLEKFLKERFQFSNTEIKIKYSDSVKIKPIEEEWKNLICYVVHKYPVMGQMMLLKSEIEVEGNTLTVNMKIQGADFLRARKLDKELEKVINDLFGKDYKIKFVEKIDETEEKQLKERQDLSKKKAIEKALEHMAIGEKLAEEVNKDHSQNKVNQEAPKEEPAKEKKGEEENKQEEETPLIYGRTQNFKTNIIKITDISPEDDMAAINGEILAGSIEEKELKSGKFLISFNVYDGTSTVSCKIFVKPEEKAKIIKKLANAKGVKLEGKSGISNFTHEMEILANVVVETEGVKRETRQDLAEEKRVELHMHTQMSQMDGMTSATDLIKRAMKWGWKSIAITDHGVVQAFPEAHIVF